LSASSTLRPYQFGFIDFSARNQALSVIYSGEIRPKSIVWIQGSVAQGQERGTPVDAGANSAEGGGLPGSLTHDDLGCPEGSP
jgi:hypothetical protein